MVIINVDICFTWKFVNLVSNIILAERMLLRRLVDYASDANVSAI